MSSACTRLLHLLLVGGLVAGYAGDADAKGKRGGFSSSGSKAVKDKDDGPSMPSIKVRVNNSSSSSDSAAPATGAALSGAAAGAAASVSRPAPTERTPEELAAIERNIAEKAAADKAAAEKLEADRLALAKAEADRAAERAARERAEAAKAAAAAEKQRKEQAQVTSDVDRVLARAKADYPVLNTPEGEPVLRRILARQKALADRGMYPSVAMVEAVADHTHLLAPQQPQQQKKEAQTIVAPAEEQKPVVPGCRWVTPTQWSCK